MKPAAKATAFDLKVEFGREAGGRWIADIPALAAVEALAPRVIAERIEHGEAAPGQNTFAAGLAIGSVLKHNFWTLF